MPRHPKAVYAWERPRQIEATASAYLVAKWEQRRQNLKARLHFLSDRSKRDRHEISRITLDLVELSEKIRVAGGSDDD